MSEMLRDRVTKAIAAVTDLWDEPLDDVHDIPPLVQALLPIIAAERANAAAEAWEQGVRADEMNDSNPYRAAETSKTLS